MALRPEECKPEDSEPDIMSRFLKKNKVERC